MTGAAKHSPEWYEARNARARERSAAERAALPRPGTPAFDALRSYDEKARARNHYWRELQNDARALLAAIRDARALLIDGDAEPADADRMTERLAALLEKHEGADR